MIAHFQISEATLSIPFAPEAIAFCAKSTAHSKRINPHCSSSAGAN